MTSAPREKVKIFLSYARKDDEKVTTVYQKLCDHGFKPWMDKNDVLPGENVELAIHKAIRNCDFFLACLSINSLGERGALQIEIKTALDIWRTKLDDDIYLIPARLENCEIPESLCNFKGVNLFDDDGWTKLKLAFEVGMQRRLNAGGQNDPVLQGFESVTTLEILINITKKEDFDETKQRLFRFALAGFLEISPDNVRTRLIKQASVKVSVDLPTESAEKLLHAYKKKDADLFKRFESFSLRHVRRHKLRIFVAWPSDVEIERDRAEAIIQELHQYFLPRDCYLEMLDWRKSVPPEAGNPEDIILEASEPATWDVFIGILWKRFGTPLKLMNPHTHKPFASGFEAEYQCAHDLWQENERPHIMLYRCIRPIPHNTEVDQLGHVQNFFQRIEKHYEVLYKEFDSPDDFANKLKNDLTAVIEKLLQPDPETAPIAFPRSRLFEEIAEETDFSNRENELALIQNWLSTDPEASILVHAPAGMGKSRFMEQLREVVRTPSSETPSLEFHYVKLDCYSDEKISNSVAELLLVLHQNLPQPKVSSPVPADLIPALRYQAITLKGQKRRLIILLDRVELMSGECRAFIRQNLLPVLRKAVYEPIYCPILIACGRIYPREWRGRDTVRFKTIELSPFSKGVIKDILFRKQKELKKKEGLDISLPDDAYDKWAESILNISHGHPRCIVNLVSWLYEQRFSVPADFDSKEIFLGFVWPVIEREIFSEDNLAPQEAVEKKSETTKRLRQLLPYISLFRSYSRAELRILIHCKVIEDDKIDELEKLLRSTFLIDRVPNQASFKPHETIRQLLADSIYYQNPEAFRLIHQTAWKFYDDWITGSDPAASSDLLGKDLDDYDQIHYMIEGLYHQIQAERGQISTHDLQVMLQRYRNSIRNSARHSAESLLDKLDELMLEEPELRKIVTQQIV